MDKILKHYKKQTIIFSVFLILVISIIVVKIVDNEKKNENVISLESVVETKEEKIDENENTIIIHITGAIANEGIIKIPEGSRIADAIEKAGGLKENANLKNVNLAYQLEDGQKLYIPYIEEENTTEYIDNGVSEEVVIDSNNSNNEMININKADANELQTLNGIGEATAIAIIKYREENGDFESPEDLKNVPGIGDNKFEVIKDKIKTK
ncbi:MAG: ComEA family DNA-binding protein [Clostridia bacterium]|nr:ComEA family DNA-binding protein [Clostridia bacterium]